jgi:hypothetical protein
VFQQPSQGDQVKIAELVGSLVLVYVRELRENIQTAFGPSDAVAVDLHVLQGPSAGESFENTLIFQKALIGSLRSAVGGDPVLGRVGQGTAKPGQSPPYILHPFTDADAAIATAWIQARPGQFQAPANGRAAVPAPGQAAPSPAPATSPAAPPATPAGNSIDYSALPPEVQELLRQSGAMPR